MHSVLHQPNNRNSLAAKTLSAMSKYFVFLTFSQRNGTWLTSWYTVYKVLSICNCVLQLYILGSIYPHENHSAFSMLYVIFQHLVVGKTWLETGVFPRRGLCYIDDFYSLAIANKRAYNCVMSSNVLNEAAFICIYLWIVVLTILSVYSMLKWMRNMFASMLKIDYITSILNPDFVDLDPQQVERFVTDYLRSDGVFTIHMIEKKCGNVCVNEFVTNLYDGYVKNEAAK